METKEATLARLVADYAVLKSKQPGITELQLWHAIRDFTEKILTA